MLIVLAISLGWMAGAVVNYLADVLPWKRKLSRPFCLECQQEMLWVNYLIWPRRCTQCGKSRAWRVWLVEMSAVTVSLWLWLTPPDRIGYGLGMIIWIFFGIVVVIDLEHRLILHPISLAGAGLGLVVGVYLHGLIDTLLGGLAGFGIMFLLYGLGIFFMKVSSRMRGQPVEEDALGYGDVNLSGVLGLMLGWPGILAGLTIAILLGGVVSLIYLLFTIVTRRYQAFTAIPYGPFLIAAAIALLFFRGFLISNL
jgi:leader peptidase (prepilin peptidase) / N-methyltransferase